MAEYTQVPINTFVGGLLTERGELTFPENASVDELNCDLLKTGARRRRLGLAIEAGSSPTTEILDANTIVSTHVWENVGEQADTDFTVLQVGSTLMFFDQGDGTGSLSANRVDTTFTSGVEYALDMSTFQRPTGGGAASAEIQVASIKGALVVASSELNTFYITRDLDTGAFTETEIDFRVRDFDWLGDRTIYREAQDKDDVTIQRAYDTRNCGWNSGGGSGSSSSSNINISGGLNNIAFLLTRSNAGNGDTALETYINTEGEFPALTHPWYSGKNSSGNFSVSEWKKVFTGSSFIVNGSFILDLYSKDRETASGLDNSSLNTTEDSRFSTVASYTGRIFYAGMANSTDDNGSKIFFSQVLEEKYSLIGECFQQNDPTSQELSDLLDTDGGFISIPEAHNIRKLHPFGPYLFVFASNGVWQIGGVDDVFRATDYTVSKISEDGLSAVGSFVSAQGQPYWWSNSGIFRVGAAEGGGFGAQNLSVSSIQSFWELIDADKRDKVTSVYDEAQRRISWIYPDNSETVDTKRNNLLIWDEVLEAWFPWTVSDEAANTNYIVDATFVNGIGASTTTSNVITNGGQLVQTSGGDQVVTTITSRASASSKAKYLVVDGDTGKFTFAEFTDTDFQDWGSADYSSYAEAAYSFMGDLETRKTSPYLTTFMKDTATGFNDDGGGVYSVLRDSSILVSAYYDFNRNPTTISQQGFRRKSVPAVDTSDLSNWTYPRTVIPTRLKLRGRGRSMRLRFESEAGKDFHLLGYNVVISRPGRF